MVKEIMSIGLILIIIGFILIIIGSIKGEAKIGFGGFIGPFAFGWANDPEVLKLILIVTIVLAILFIVIALKGII